MFNFDDASQKSKEAMEAVLKNYSVMSQSLQAIATETADYTKKSFEEGVAHAEKLASVKSVEAAVELQTAFVKSSFENMVAEAKKVSEMYADLAKVAYKPYESFLGKARDAAQQMSNAA